MISDNKSRLRNIYLTGKALGSIDEGKEGE